jgi:hypothetical protein
MSAFVPTNGMGLLIGLLFALLEPTEGRKALIKTPFHHHHHPH